MIIILIPTRDVEKAQATGELALVRAGCEALLHIQVDRGGDGFTRTVNAGLAQIPDGDVCLLNDDCRVPENWLADLARELERFAPLRAQFTGPSGPCRTAPQNGGRPGDRRPSRPVDHLAGFCLLIQRAALADGLDEDFMHYGSDVALQWRARKKCGALSIWVPGVYVYHELHDPHAEWWNRDNKLLEVKYGEKS